MTSTLAPPPEARPSPQKRKRRARRTSSPSAHGEPLIWLTGGALGLSLAMILGLIGFVTWQGAITFWPGPAVQVTTVGGDQVLGELSGTETFQPVPELLSEDLAARAEEALADGGGEVGRELIRSGNFDITGTHFRWIADYEATERTFPEWAIVVERLTWGRFYGFPKRFLVDGEEVASTPEDVWKRFEEHHGEARGHWRERRDVETHVLGKLSHELERSRLELRAAELEHGVDSEAYREELERHTSVEAASLEESGRVEERIASIREQEERFQVVLETAGGVEQTMILSQIVRAYPANQLSFGERLAVYGDRWKEFVIDEPREANNEGGVFPAIFGTVVMTLLMSVIVVPFGVLAALYLREYARQGLVTSVVRIAVNNLAGVPSIVFGVFGLGFFCYIFGASLDELFFAERLPAPTYGTGGIFWASLTLALLTLPVVIVATEEALSAVPNSMREGSYACGATKWQTIRRIVLPRAAPGIMTGTILAIARGAGEVAPLMLVGAVKIAPELPIDRLFPFVHPERSFMHLGFHIFDLGFQSQNSEAAKPMVFTTTLLLISIVVSLNVFAVVLRGRLRKRAVGQV